MNFPELEVIDDLVAEDWWAYVTAKGEERVTRVSIGRPRTAPEAMGGGWYCPIKIDDFTHKVLCLGGVGPVDALANAMRIAKAFEDSVGGVSPGAKQPTGERF
ncbi:hypothetical protein [Corallococcus exercitus]|nr:hypothetical protein [Corallococcus exercitus]